MHSHIWVGRVFFFLISQTCQIKWVITKICKNKGWSVKSYQIQNILTEQMWFLLTISVSFICSLSSTGKFFFFLFLTNHFWQIVGKLNSEELSVGFQVNLNPREDTQRMSMNKCPLTEEKGNALQSVCITFVFKYN